MVSLADTGTLLVTNVETDGTGKPTGFLNPDFEWTQNLESSISDMAYFGLSELFIVWQKPPPPDISSEIFFQNVLNLVYPSLEDGQFTRSIKIQTSELGRMGSSYDGTLYYSNPPDKETITLSSLPHYEEDWVFEIHSYNITEHQLQILQMIYTDVLSLFLTRPDDIQLKHGTDELLYYDELFSLRFNDLKYLIPKYDYLPILPLFKDLGDLYEYTVETGPGNDPLKVYDLICLNLKQYTDYEDLLEIGGGIQKDSDGVLQPFYAVGSSFFYRTDTDNYYPNNMAKSTYYIKWLGHRGMTYKDRIRGVGWDEYWQNSVNYVNRTITTITPSCTLLKPKDNKRRFATPKPKSNFCSGTSASSFNSDNLTKNYLYENNYIPTWNQHDLALMQTTLRIFVNDDVDFIIKSIPEDNSLIEKLDENNYLNISDYFLLSHNEVDVTDRDPSDTYLQYTSVSQFPSLDFGATNIFNNTQALDPGNFLFPIAKTQLVPLLVGSDENQDEHTDCIPTSYNGNTTDGHLTDFVVYPVPSSTGEPLKKLDIPSEISWKSQGRWNSTLDEGFKGQNLNKYLLDLAKIPEAHKRVSTDNPFQDIYTMHFSLNCEECQLVQLGSSKEPFMRWGVFEVISENSREVVLMAKFNPNDIQFRPLASRSNNNSFKFKLRTLANKIPEWYLIPGSYTSLHATIRYLQTFNTKNFNDTDVHY